MGSGLATNAATFGDTLRSLRFAARLTQEELAMQAGMSVRGISDLERGVRRNPRRATIARLGQALRLDRGQQDLLEKAARDQWRRDPGTGTVIGRDGRLPVPPTSFVGREGEIAHLRTVLRRADIRLVTLTGPGGVGKTRLAVRTAERSRFDHADGAAFVPLASVRDPAHVMPTILRALGMGDDGHRSPVASIAAALASRDLLLVVDNLEHLLAVGPMLSELLAACPSLTMLATSRSVLQVSGEHVHPVLPLTLPDPEPLPPGEERLEAESIRLFMERARAATGATLAPDCVADVAAVCRRLDGLPLAIELAAAQMRTLSPRTLLPLLEHRLSVLVDGPRDAPARLRTMRDAIAWSHDLLPSDMQVLFRRLSVFVGGFTIDAASAVLDARDRGERDLLFQIAYLVDRSLCFRVDKDETEPRFGMLETIREFGLERLARSGELARLQRQHATCFLALAEHLRPDIEGPHGQRTLHTLEVEHPNLRAALAWLWDAGETGLYLQLTEALWKFWQAHAHVREGLTWLARALTPRSEEAHSRRRWQPLYAAGSFARQLGDYAQAVVYSEELLAHARTAGDAFHTGLALLTLGLVAHDQGDQWVAKARLEAALPFFQDINHQHAEAMVRSFLANVFALLGDDTAATAHVDCALAIWQARGDPWGEAIARGHKGNVLRGQGAYAPAAACYRESLRLRAQLADTLMMADCLEEWSMLAVMDNDLEWAARLLGKGGSLRDRLGTPWPPAREITCQQAMDTMRNRLGGRGFATAIAAGRAATIDQILADATSVAPGNEPQQSAGTPNAAARRIGLTRREVDVLRHLVEGNSDQEIADALCVSRRTVTSHVTSILTKLQTSSRTAAATRAVRAQLI